MLHTSTQKLIQKICELTESSDIVWKEAPEGRCRFETEGYQIEVAEEPPLVRLLSPEGRELEKAEAADLAIAWPGGDGTFATHVADMARRAHRVARGAEHAITRILSSLSAPPKKSFAPPEPEPMPAAIEFDQPQSQPMARKSHQLSAGESAASIAALNADMISQRRQPEPPPSPHTAPAPQPAPPRPQTAIDAVLAAEASAPESEPAIAAAEEELPLEDAPPTRHEPPPIQAAPIQTGLGQPAPRASAPPPVEDAKPALTNAPSLAQAQPPRPSAPLAKPASNLFMTGFSAVSRPAPRPEPQPAPPPAPAAKAAPEPPAQPSTPAPQPEPPRAPEMATPAKPPRTGQEIYKPW